MHALPIIWKRTRIRYREGMSCAEFAASSCDEGLVGWWVKEEHVPVDMYGRRADEACCACGGGHFEGSPTPWCMTTGAFPYNP